MKHRSHNKFHRFMACKSLMVELGKSGLRPCQVRKAQKPVNVILKIFELFQKEWIEATTNLTHETKRKSEEKSCYWVGRVNVDKKYWRIVNFCFVDDLDVTCSCAMFETYGILCKHILYVMKRKHVDTLPDHYIIVRWTLDCRYKGGNASIGIEETNSENGVSALALWYVQANLTKAIEQARDAAFEIKRLNSFLVEFLEDQMIRKKPTEIEKAYKMPVLEFLK
nr:hypothetical protein [Tanacetum cinerariifolium]